MKPLKAEALPVFDITDQTVLVESINVKRISWGSLYLSATLVDTMLLERFYSTQLESNLWHIYVWLLDPNALFFYRSKMILVQIVLVESKLFWSGPNHFGRVYFQSVVSD